MLPYLVLYLALSTFLQLIPILGSLCFILINPCLQAGFWIVSLKQVRGQTWTFTDFFLGFRKEWGNTLILNALLYPVLWLIYMIPAVIVWAIAMAVMAFVFDERNPTAASETVAAIAMVLIYGYAVTSLYVLLRAGIFCTPLIVDRGCGAVEAFKGSWILTRGHFWGLLGLLVLIAIAQVAGLLALGVGVLFTFPYGVLMVTIAYLHAVGEGPVYQGSNG
jgi:hypothetical protein